MSKKTAAKPQQKTSASKAVAVRKEPQLPSKLADKLFATSGAGMGSVTAADIIIPRLTILQLLSPQCMKSKPEFIKEAKPGMICDTATGELWDGDKGIIVLPVLYKVTWLEWAPRKTNRGLVAIHDTKAILDECTKDDKGANITPEGNKVIETAQFYALNVTDDNRQVFIPFAGTQRKKAKKWMTLATSERIVHTNGDKFIPALFYRKYLLTTVMESNDQGEWFGWNIARGDTVDDEQFEDAINYLKSVEAGTMKMNTDELMREATQRDGAM